MSIDLMPVNRCPDCGIIYQIGDYPFCRGGHGRPGGGLLIASIHPSERAVIYRNLKTGEHRTPARADQPMPQVYARQGYVREELDTAAKRIAFEHETGLIHESSHYHNGSGGAERDLAAEPEPYKRDPELTRKLVQSIS